MRKGTSSSTKYCLVWSGGTSLARDLAAIWQMCTREREREGAGISPSGQGGLSPDETIRMKRK